MATGIIGVMAGAGTITYSPTVNAKVQITVGGSSTGSVTLNGAVGVFTNPISSPVYVGAGQTLTLVTVASSYAVLSCLEEDAS